MKGEKGYGMYEVFYNDEDEVNGWTEDSVIGYFETVEDLLLFVDHLHEDAHRYKDYVLSYEDGRGLPKKESAQKPE